MSIVIALVIVLIVGGLIVRFYPHPKKELEVKPQVLPTPSFQSTDLSSIHDEIAKTVEDIKAQVSIEEPTKKTTKKTTKKSSKIDIKKKPTKKTIKK